MTYNKKTYYAEYDLRFADGINTIKGFILAENEIDAQQQINQIASDLKADEHFVDVIKLAEKSDWEENIIKDKSGKNCYSEEIELEAISEKLENLKGFV